jgi:sec-independent protein translocase protein TatA
VIGDILQPTHLLFVLVVALLVLGPKRLPEVARQLGSGMRDLRAAISGEDRHDRDTSDQALAHPDDAPVDEHPDMSAFHDDHGEVDDPGAPADHPETSTPGDHADTAQPAATAQPVAPTDKPA